MNVRKKGFTLIELMIALAIVAILVALALPAFQDVIRKSRRSDGMEALVDIHLTQERYRVNNITYADLSDLGYASDTIASPDGHYNLTVTNHTTTNYTITADAQGDQVNDSCGDFILNFVAGVITKTADGDNDQCWKK